jgi:glycosyltransferase involved in cell wall biosynthesis
LKQKANQVYRSADAIVSVSKTYVNRAKLVNRNAQTAVVFLGTDKEQFDKNRNKKENSEIFKVVYIGSLEKSYDLTTAIQAVSMCEKTQLVVIGDGARRSELEDFAKSNKADCVFLGYLPYAEMIAKMSECSVALNPIHKGSAASIINKVGDYAIAGLPVINTQESREYRELLEEYACGINCECENVDDVIKAIKVLSDDEDLRKKMSLRARQMGECLFDRMSTYSQIKDLIASI